MHSFEKLKIVGLQIMYMENIKNYGMEWPTGEKLGPINGLQEKIGTY